VFPAAFLQIGRQKDTPALSDIQGQHRRDADKKRAILALAPRPGGASLEELMMATGWMRHSARGAMSTMARTTRITCSKSESRAHL